MLAKISALPESLSIRNSSMTDLAGCSSLLWLGVVSTWSDDNIFVCFFPSGYTGQVISVGCCKHLL